MSLQKVAYGFIPTQISGCVLWLDGADPAGNGVIPANGASITTWTDKSGLGNNATGGVSPTFNTSGINSKGTISFNGTNSYLNSADLFSNRSFSIFIIIRRQASISSQTGILAGTQFNTNMNLHFVFRSSTNLALGFYSNDLDYVSFTNYTGNPATEPAYLIQATYISGTRILYVNGNQVASDTNTTNLSSQVGALIGQYNGTYYNGFIGEICILNGAPNSTSRQQIEGYLAQKWGLTSSLPSSHPGRSTTIYRSDFTKQNVMRAIPYYTQFSPRQISGCALWLDAADSSTITLSGSSVTQWNDKSINGWNVSQATSAKRPTLVSNSLNGLPGLNFIHASSQHLDTANQSSLNSLTGLTLFYILKPTWNIDDPVQNPAFFGIRAPGGGVTIFNYYFINNYSGTALFNGAPITSHTGSSVTSAIGKNVVSLYCSTNNNGTDIAYLNGNLTGDTVTGASFGSGTNLPIIIGGDNYDPYENWQGLIYEVVFFTRVLSTTERQQVESYLTQKWGLTASLPGGHSHATQPTGAVTRTALTNFRIISRPRFLPTHISGIQLWLDAADSSSITGTTTVTQWRDKSGNTRHMGVGSGTTSYSSGAIQLTNSYMFVTSAVNLINVTVFIVVKTTGGNNQTVFSGRPNSNVNWDSLDGFGFYMDSTSAIRFYGQQPTGKFSTFSVNTSTPRLFSFKSTGTSVSGWYQGVSQTGGTLSSTRTSTAQGFAIGGEWQGSSYSNIVTNASFYEIIVYNSDMTDNQRQQIEGYLAWKWGLQASLPAGHPYLSAAPA